MEEEDEDSYVVYGSKILDFDEDKKETMEEEKVEECSEVGRDLSMCNMGSWEALLTILPKNEYKQVKFNSNIPSN